MSFLVPYRNTQNPVEPHFCAGCGHGNLLKFVNEALESMCDARRAIWVSPVGCGGLTDSYLDMHHILAAHGRASAVATAVKRLLPEAVVIVSQGDGDLASIGLAEAMHAANRGEDLCLFFMNNANFAMTGGQMAPTTLLGQKTATSRDGRMLFEHGAPLHLCELMNTLEGPAFIARVAFGSVSQIREARKIIHKAVKNQIEHRGYSFVEILSPCPSNWHCTPIEARKRVADEMTRVFPTGVFRDEDKSDRIAQRHPMQAFEPHLSTDVLYDLVSSVGGLANHESTALPIAIEGTRDILAAGFGGQGVLTLGKVLARLALDAHLQATWMPSYGPEMRGGVCRCHIKLSKHAIACPVVDRPDLFFAFNQPSFDTFSPHVAPNGLIIYDSDMVRCPESCQNAIGIPATTLANVAGKPRSANIIMLMTGLLRANFVSSPAACLDAISRIMKQDYAWLADIL
ncbi:MAG: 2-oxoacid:acceptor oxidoreductase family protein [Proteobacteria bacterium]|nr:2-oxoacid:acceptor oxidoreductase family protein [Pseudomonadota bacterium]